jgi:arylsulfatase A-like enzyme
MSSKSSPGSGAWLTTDPFSCLNRKPRWQGRALRWRRQLARPFRPSRIDSERQGPPHLFLVGIDTLRADHLGCYGCSRPLSPQLDRLAGRGTLFRDVTAPAPWTLPSFSSALTGVMPGVHGGYLSGEIRNMDSQPPGKLKDGTTTLATHLAAQGYRTAAFYSNQFFAFGLAESFQEYHYHNLPAGDLLEMATDWMARHADEPVFCFVLLNDPHEPTTPPREDLAPFLPELQAVGAPTDPASLARYARWGEHPGLHLGRTEGLGQGEITRALAIKRAIYDATIHYVDRSLANVVDWLEQTGLARQTLCSVFADHGEEFLDHVEFSRRWNHDPRGIHGIGHGHTMFQELLHVPWFSWGAGVPAGTESREPVSLCDLPFTLCDWMGLPPLPVDLRDEGFASYLRGRSQAHPQLDEQEKDRTILAEAMAYGPDLVTVRRGRWKLMAHRHGQPLALFDLLGSPEEAADLAMANPEVVAELVQVVEAWRDSGHGAGGDPSGGSWDDMEDTVRQRLKDLGYSE